MPIIRSGKNKNYTVMSNIHLQDKNLSLKAKGLLSKMLSLPDDWNFSLNGLEVICKESKTAIRSVLKELETFRYLKREKLLPSQTESKTIEYIYTIYEDPKFYPGIPKGYTDKEHMDSEHALNLYTDNKTQIIISKY